MGKRLAFDSDRGRLWAVCPACERWNLTPLEERWEALEECERAYRDTRKRVSTDNIALARLRDGTDLIRIGQPLRPEFAAWRYERVIAKRRWKQHGMVALAAGAPLAAGAINAASMSAFTNMVPLIGGGLLAISAGLGHGYWHNYELYWRRHMRIEMQDGSFADLTLPQLQATKCSVDATNGLRLGLTFGGHRRRLQRPLIDEQQSELSGDAAHVALRRVIVGMNCFGAARDAVRSAVTVIEDAVESGSVGTDGLLADLFNRHRIALEMVLHEEDERRAMAGELGALYARWEDAERIAKISDGALTLVSSGMKAEPAHHSPVEPPPRL